MHILMVAKDIAISDSQLCDERSDIVRVPQTDDAMSILLDEVFDLAVVDLAVLADQTNGFIQRWRSMTHDAPVVALTRTQADRIRALTLGADDTIGHSIHSGELQARLRAVVRRHKGYTRSLLQWGDLSLSLASREACFGGSPVHLTATEYVVLELLVLRQGQIIPPELMLCHLLANGAPPATTIGAVIRQLGSKLAAAGADGLIGTTPDGGCLVRDIGGTAQPGVLTCRALI